MKLLVSPATPKVQHNFTCQLGSSKIISTRSCRNFGVIFNGQLSYKDYTAKTAQSCGFALHSIRKIRSLLIKHAAELVVQADFQHLQSDLIENAAAQPFNEPKRAHITSLFTFTSDIDVYVHIRHGHCSLLSLLPLTILHPVQNLYGEFAKKLSVERWSSQQSI